MRHLSRVLSVILIASSVAGSIASADAISHARALDAKRLQLRQQPSRIANPRTRFTARLGQVTGFNLDWDDNTIVMPTKIWVTHKETNKEIGLTTTQWAEHKNDMGKPGPYEKYFLKDPDSTTGGLRDFFDHPGRNLFLRDLKQAVKEKQFGLSWNAFVASMKNKRTARQTTFITARGHAPESVYAGLRWLQKEGYIRYVPPKANLFTVMNPDFKIGGKPAEGSPSQRKAQLMLGLLDEVQGRKIEKNAKAVITPDGSGRRPMHLWGFSDDDYGNFSKAVEVLSKEVKRWPDVKIKIIFTGLHHPTEKPHAIILTADGKSRAPLPAERSEVTNIIGGWNAGERVLAQQ